MRTAPGFAAGCLIETVCGLKSVETLRPGDALANGENAAVEVRDCFPVARGTSVAIAEGAIFGRWPSRALSLGSDQMIGLSHPDALTLVGHRAPWVAARDLMKVCAGVQMVLTGSRIFGLSLSGADTLVQAGLELRGWPVTADDALRLTLDAQRGLRPRASRIGVHQGDYDGRPVLDAREVMWLFERKRRRR